MKQFALFFLVLISLQTNEAQQKDLNGLVSQMSGAFIWEMTKPASQTMIRKGERTSEPYFEGQLFMFRETFFDSKIEQVGFFGYDTKEKQVLSVGLYNVDMGPHILKGTPEKLDKGYLVTFFEKDKKIVLHIENREHHFWKYYSKNGDQWMVDDLQIDFYRNPKE
jgi:hypothetical protein